MLNEDDSVSGGRLTPDQYLGSFLRKYRLDKHLTLADVSMRANISKGMLSKIENGQTSASLSTLSKLAQALGLTLSSLFQNYDVPAGGAQLVKAGEGMEVVRRGTRRGHTYQLLAYDKGPTQIFEPFLITIIDKNEKFPTFEHPG
ncbi:MAG: helix-turn-helix domain-containing protein, partial [Rubrobacter sp.]